MRKQDIKDILGLENEFVKEHKELCKTIISEFRELAKQHDPNNIWLKGDYPYYEGCGQVICETANLVVVR